MFSHVPKLKRPFLENGSKIISKDSVNVPVLAADDWFVGCDNAD